MSQATDKVDLLRFTFDSLYFCGTHAETLRSEHLLVAVNQWYMPLIRAGWAVPLAFVVDVSTLMLWPGTALRERWKGEPRKEVHDLSLEYYKMLRNLRRQPIFEAVVDLLRSNRDESLRNQATKTFLRFLLAELSHFRETYAFNTREMKLLAARRAGGGRYLFGGRVAGEDFRCSVDFNGPGSGGGRNEMGTVFDMMREITSYYTEHQLAEFISPEEWLMVEIAANSPAGISRVDYAFLRYLLAGRGLTEIDEHEPRPRMVRRIVPTESQETDGAVGGYIDINRRRFSGSMAEVLPSELALFGQRHLMYQKLLNEGALQCVREDIECIEEELRVLFCFVVDTDDRMRRAPLDVDPAFHAGMTPYVRARALAALMTRDLAEFLPRKRVQADFALYLWNSKADHVYRTELQLRSELELGEAWSQAALADSFRFAAGLAGHAPPLFHHRVGGDAARENIAMDADPGRYVSRRNQSRLYHCRHMVFFTSSQTVQNAFPESDPGIIASDSSGDSLFVIFCDVNRATLGLFQPRTLSTAAGELVGAVAGQLSEERLRTKFLTSVLLKGAGKTPPPDVCDISGDL